MKKMVRLLCIIITLFSAPALCAVKLPRLISDGMVLQRNIPLKIWGWADHGNTVSVRFNGHLYKTTAGENGKWLVMLPPQKAGGPFDMHVISGDSIIVRDILVGDVWVCSGQSNMELTMNRVKYKYPDIIAGSENPFIRHFTVPMTYDFNQRHEDMKAGTWESANPDRVLNFSAVGYFFARALYDKYHVPIGMIRAAVGGSPAEAWLSRDALKSFPDYLHMAELCADSAYINSIRRKEKKTNQAWYYTLAKNDQAYQNGGITWRDTAFDASAWPVMKVPGYWTDLSNGCVWFRKMIDLPASMTGLAGKLQLGRIIDADSVFLNGRFVGTTGYQYPPRIYDIPAGLLKPGKNILVVKVINTAGQGAFVPDKPYEIRVGDQKLDLSGEWQYQVSTTMEALPSETFFQYKPMGLFNGMISPLLNFAIKGVIWYQGESNASKPIEYASLLPALIHNWRTDWDLGEIPFLWVQLPNYMNPVSTPSESDWAQMRYVQLQTLSIPNTGMAVTHDIGEWNDIHPLNKMDVGKRLAAEAERVAYEEKNRVTSPVYKSMEIKGNQIIISFSNVGSGLVAKGGGPLKYFSIAGNDRKFVWANAIIKKDKVIVWNDDILHPEAVRYAWADNPEGANLYNIEGFPASSFSTEKP